MWKDLCHYNKSTTRKHTGFLSVICHMCFQMTIYIFSECVNFCAVLSACIEALLDFMLKLSAVPSEALFFLSCWEKIVDVLPVKNSKLIYGFFYKKLMDLYSPSCWAWRTNLICKILNISYILMADFFFFFL